MVLETKIEAVVVAGVDKGSFNKLEQTARDTGKKIDQQLKAKLEIDVANAQIKLKKLRTQLKDVTLPVEKRRQLIIETNRTQRNLTEAKRKLNNLINTGDQFKSRFQTAFDGIGKNILSSIVNPVTLAIGAIYKLGRVIVNASKTAIAFETAFVGVQKTFDATTEGYAELDLGLRKLAKRLPITYTEIAGVAEIAGQLGVKGVDNMLAFTEVALGLGIATNLGAEEAATSLKRFADVLGVPIDQIENLGSALVGLGNNFAANEQEILNFAKRMQTAGVVSNLTATEILGLSTALVASGISAESGGSAMVRTFSLIQKAASKGGASLEKFAKVAGLTAEEFQEAFAKDSGEAFAKFLEGLKSTGTDAGLVLEELGVKSVKMVNALLSGAGNVEILSAALKEANVAFTENVALQDEVNKRLESTEGRLIVANNKWTDLSASAGKGFNNVRVPLFEGITNGTERMVMGFKIAKVIVSNAFDNMGIAMFNLGASITNAFMGGKSKIVGFINTAIKAYNRVVGVIGGEGIQLIDIEATSRIEKKAFKSAKDGIDAIVDEYNLSKKRRLETSKATVEQEIKDEQNLLKEILGIDDKKTKGKGDSLKDYETAVKDMTKVVGKSYDDLTKKIEGSVIAQKKLKDEISDIDKDIASRIVEIDEALAGDDLDYSEKKDLTEEKKSAFVGIEEAVEKDPIKIFEMMTDEEKAQILSDFQELQEKGKAGDGKETFTRLISDAEKEKLKSQVDEIAEYEKLSEIEKLQALKAEKQIALEEEVILEAELIAQKEALQNDYADFLAGKVAEEMDMAEKLRQKRLAVAAARSKAGGSGGDIPGRAAGGPITAGSPYVVGERGPELIIPENNGQVIPNHNVTINQNVDANVANGVDIDALANQLARKITLAGKGIT